jgi:hypothetical protein
MKNDPPTGIPALALAFQSSLSDRDPAADVREGLNIDSSVSGGAWASSK